MFISTHKRPYLLRTIFSTFLFLSLAIGFLCFPASVRESLAASLSYCFSSLIPSLFPFIALTSYAVNAPVSRFFDRYLGFISKYLFRLPRVCTVTILMGLIGGYPAGASGVSNLLKNGDINKKEAGRLLCFCVNPGIAFIVAYVGETVLNSSRMGLFLFISILVSSIIMGIVSGFFYKIPVNRVPYQRKLSKNALIQSATDASAAMIRMTACILLFTSILAVLQGFGLLHYAAAWISSLFSIPSSASESLVLMLMEITEGIRISAKSQIPMMFFALTLAFGGICVHLQVFSFFEDFPLSKLKFFFSRIIHGILSVFCFLILLRLFPDVQTVFLNTSVVETEVTIDSGTSIAGGISLLMMCVAFLLLGLRTKTDADCKKTDDVL